MERRSQRAPALDSLEGYEAYEYWTLCVLAEASSSMLLPAIYRLTHERLRSENLLREDEKDFEYTIRWVLSNMGKDGRVKNTAPGQGEWQITDRGRVWLVKEDDFG